MRKKENNKKKINSELLELIIISILLFIIGMLLIPVNRGALSIALAMTPYGYSLLDILDKDKFKKLGKFSIVISVILRLILGAFIGVVAFPIKIGAILLEDNQI